MAYPRNWNFSLVHDHQFELVLTENILIDWDPLQILNKIWTDAISNKTPLNYCYHGCVIWLIETCCFPTEIPYQFMVSYNQILVFYVFSDSSIIYKDLTIF